LYDEGKVTHKLLSKFKLTGGLLASLCVCLLPALSVAAEQSPLLVNGQAGNEQSPMIFPLYDRHVPNGLTFDMDGADTSTLELQLAQPLTLNINNSLHNSSTGTNSVLMDSSLSLRINDNVDITGSMGIAKNQPSFQSLGSIHCQNGVLEQGSYSASDCYFLNQADALKQDQASLGLRYGDQNFSTAVSMFKLDSGTSQPFAGNATAVHSNPVMQASLISPPQNNPLLPAFAVGQVPNELSGETSGLDVEFELGLTMDKAGDVRLGLQLTRVMEASFESNTLGAGGLRQYEITSPYDSAQLDVDWRKGDFSGGVKGFYRNEVEFLNRENLDSVTTFDVHFTWRTPWNANLSVGTTNILNSGGEDRGKADSALHDPFESIYGRIPYVRYQQDL
jgi:hypothetical protein